MRGASESTCETRSLVSCTRVREWRTRFLRSGRELPLHLHRSGVVADRHACVLALDGVIVHDHEPALDAPLREAEAQVRLAPPAERLAVRAMYRRTGLDPTKKRPSSEALLRRVVRGDGLPRVNTLVDVCNWCSVEFQLPYGLYDSDRLDGPVLLRLGHPGEFYPGIRKDDIHLGGRWRSSTPSDRLAILHRIRPARW